MTDSHTGNDSKRWTADPKTLPKALRHPDLPSMNVHMKLDWLGTVIFTFAQASVGDPVPADRTTSEARIWTMRIRGRSMPSVKETVIVAGDVKGRPSTWVRSGRTIKAPEEITRPLRELLSHLGRDKQFFSGLDPHTQNLVYRRLKTEGIAVRHPESIAPISRSLLKFRP